MKLLASTLALFGCFSKPDAPALPIDAAQFDAAIDAAVDAAIDAAPDSSCVPTQPSSPGLGFQNDADPEVTFLSGARLGFASDISQYPMPTSLVINGQELIASPEGCNLEDQVGIAVYPVYSISGGNLPTTSSAHGLDREVVGPAFTQLRTNWQFRYSACSGGQATFGTGHTTWSMFPNGRIVRNDYVVPSMSEPVTVSAPPCRCTASGNDPNFIVTSYFTFETSALSSLTAFPASPMHTQEFTTPPTPSTAYPQATQGCVRGTAGGRVAFRWDVIGPPPQPNPYPTRIRTADNPGSNHRITAFVYDLITDVPTLAAATATGVRTHMLVGGTGAPNCIQLAAEASALAISNPLTVNGMTVPYSAEGVYNDFAITSRSYLAPVTISTSVSIRAGFVVAMRFETASAISTNAGPGVIWQRGTNNVFFIYFPADLISGTTITVTPEC